MEISFTPSPDVVVILNALLDKYENRVKRNHTLSESKAVYQTSQDTQPCPERSRRDAPRSIKVSLTDLPLPTYFSQTDPEPRLIANKQLQELAKHHLITLTWLAGETNHILQSASIANGVRNTQYETRITQQEPLYKLLHRTPTSNHRNNLESLILAEKFRYQKDDWRARALDHILNQLHTGKSPSPFSLTDSGFNHDLLAVLRTLSTLTAETPYRVFSVRVFNDTKRFDDLKPAIIRLARRVNHEWKSHGNEDLLRELNLVANPTYIHLSGNWELTDSNGQIININSFSPSVGFPASQINSIQRITIHAESVLCIENLTSFHQQVDKYTSKHVNNGTRPTQHAPRNTYHATICLMGNPSPAIRYLLKLIPKETPISLWSDMDYGGFNILAQLRKQISPHIQPYLMDIATFDKYAHLSRPLTQSDIHNLERLLLNPNLKDTHPTILHLLKRGLKLEQEGVEES
ncbi:MAG: hypothetical protein HYZ24_09675 [Chloroflexi bacterium]|nr:hypothetical protein [Chloroflexota bacterium]